MVEYTLATSEDCTGPCDRCHRHQPLFSFPTAAGDEYLCDCCHDVALETLRPTPAIKICRAHFPPEALELQDHAFEREEIEAAREAEVREYGASNGFTSAHDRYCVVCHATLGVDNAADRCTDHTCGACGATTTTGECCGYDFPFPPYDDD